MGLIFSLSFRSTTGSIGSMASLIFIMFIFVVAIIIVNTLSMAAMERASEIGMMRSIGARKGFLRKIFIYDTEMRSFFFGGIGITAGIITIHLLQSANITTTDEILQLVFSGEQLNPIFTYKNLLLGLVELLIVTLLAVLYQLTLSEK
jgi:ABC-type lipoprotein release transport system permease subunit